jgi:hypothetical protein
MALLDQAREAAFGLAKQKLSRGVGGDILNRVEPIVRRVINFGGNTGFVPRSAPGDRDPLSAARARLDPLLSFNWYCDLPLIDGTELSWEFVEEATLPFIEFEQTSIYRAGKQYHYPHHYNIGTLSLKLYEDSQGIATRYLDAWRRKIVDPDSGLFYLPKDYKKTITVTILDQAKATAMFLEYTGCWPMRSDAYQMTSGSAERIAPSVEFSVDEIRCKFGKFAPGQIPSIVNNVGVDFPPRVSSLLKDFPGNFVDLSFGGMF